MSRRGDGCSNEGRKGGEGWLVRVDIGIPRRRVEELGTIEVRPRLFSCGEDERLEWFWWKEIKDTDGRAKGDQS